MHINSSVKPDNRETAAIIDIAVVFKIRSMEIESE
jgi:hypothetical protein